MAIRNKIEKSFPMWFKGSIIIIAQFSKYKITISENRRSFSMLRILKMLSIFSGSRGPDGPDLPSPFGRKFQLSVQQMRGNVANINKLVQDKIKLFFQNILQLEFYRLEINSGTISGMHTKIERDRRYKLSLSFNFYSTDPTLVKSAYQNI